MAIRSLPILTLLLLAIGVLGCRSENPSAEPPATLRPVPQPALRHFEPLVQDQLRSARQALDSHLAALADPKNPS